MKPHPQTFPQPLKEHSMVKLVNNTNRITSIPKVVVVKWTDESGKTHGQRLIPDGHYHGECVPAEAVEVPDAALRHPATDALLRTSDIKIVN